MPRSAARIAGGAAVAGLATSALLLSLPHQGAPAEPAPQRAHAFGNQALAFEPDAGRVRGGADFYARVPGAGVAVSRTTATLSLGSHELTSTLAGVRPGPGGQAEGRTSLRVNSYIGSDPARHRTGLPTYRRVRYRSVYPGIDLLYHGRGDALEYDFEVAPGANPRRIGVELGGARSLRLDRDGNLVASIGRRSVRQLRPVAYQRVRGERRPVDATFVLNGNRIGFRLGHYDRSRSLLIDPVLVFADYIGSSGTDFAYDVAVDGSGNVYVGGESSSSSIPGGNVSGSGPGGYLLKIAPGGSRSWITWLSGRVTDVALDQSGNPYITGASGDGLAVTSGAAQSSFAGGVLDAFAGRLNTDGTRNWLTYFGGSGVENNTQRLSAIAVDAGGNAYITGISSSSALGTPGAYDTTAGADGDAFVVKYSASGSRLLTTYFGGSGSDGGTGIGVTPNCQSNCAVFVGGVTSSTNLPGVTAQSAEQTNEGNGDAFVVAFDGALSSPTWATYYGNTAIDEAHDLVVDHDGNPTIVGYNDPDGVPSQAFVRSYHGPTGYYVFEQKFGGNGDDMANGVDADAYGNLFVIGNTGSSDFPVVSPVQQFQSGGGDAFILKIDRNSLYSSGGYVWSTYYGGGSVETGNAVAAGPAGDLYAVGDTFSNDLPRIGSTQTSSNPYDGWIAKIEMKPVVIASGPEGKLRSHDASFTYSLAEPQATFQCRLIPVETSFSVCTNDGKSYTGLLDGQYTFEIVGADSSSTLGRTVSRSFEVDTRPIAALAVAPNPALVGRAVTFDASGSSGANQALVKFEWDLDGDGTFERDTGSSATTTQTFSSPRDHAVSVRVTDVAGAGATATTQLKVNAPPGVTQFGVTINKGAQYTKSPNVTVGVVFPSGITSMLFSNDGGFLEPTTFAPQASVKWKLDSSGPERLPKTIYVRFLTGSFAGETFQDDIILDETPPKVTEAAVAPAVPIASGARLSALRRWKVRMKAKDTNSGVSGVQVTSNKRKPGKLLRYKKRFKVKSAKRPRWVRARDKAGNYSKWREAR